MSRQNGEVNVLRAAGAMGAATFVSRIMGLAREWVFAYLFGAGNAMDAYIVAFRIPNLLRDLFAEGAMSASLVPTFTRVRLEEGDQRAWRVAGLVFRVLIVIVGCLALLGMFFAPQLVNLYAGAFHQIPGKYELTVRMTRTMFPFFPLVALAAAFMGILNACNVFFLPALASAFFNVGSIAVGVAFSLLFFKFGNQWGIQPIEGMAIGVVAGGAVQAFCQLPKLYRMGYRWEPGTAQDPHWRKDPALRRMLGMMIPGTIGLAATQVNVVINSMLATSQGPGAVSWLGYSFRLMQFPIGLFGVSMAAATLPTVSRLWVEKRYSKVTETLSQSLRHVFAINLPASAGLAFLGAPIIAMIYQYGHFNSEDTLATARALAMYAVGLTAYSAVKVLVPACYAMGNTRVPVISSALTVVVTVVFNLIMIRPFGYWGLALGTSIGALFNSCWLLLFIRRMLARQGEVFHLWPIFRAFLAQLVVALLMGAICYATLLGLNHWAPESGFLEHFGRKSAALVRIAKMLILVLEGGAVVLLLARILGLSDTTQAVDIFTEKLKKKLSRKGR